jgi:beta-glucosidase
MHSSPTFSRRAQLRITAIACTMAIAITVGCGGGSSDDAVIAPPAGPALVAAAEQRATAMLAQMTLDEKVNMLHGELNNFFGFYNGPIERLGIPSQTMADGPSGVRVGNPNANGRRATQMPAALALAATWDTTVAQEYGRLIGDEAHKTGHNIQLGPSVDIVRVPFWGRAVETYGEDPLLAGSMGAAFIRGVQEAPVIATVKHVIAYTQERNRLFGNNTVMDERTLREIYARPFEIAVRDGNPGAAMCSFNQINGVYACENEPLLNQLLKKDFGFTGWVMADYNARFETVPAILAGMDQDMPGNFTPEIGPGDCRYCAPLLNAVRDGRVPISRIDDAVLRMLRKMYFHKLFDAPPVIEPLAEAAHGAQARAIASKAMVLLKNNGAALPLPALDSIVVIGTDADSIVATGGSALVKPTYAVSILQGIRSRAGAGVQVQYIGGADPVTSVAIMPGPDPVPSDFLTPAQGPGRGLRAEYFLNPIFSGTPERDRTDPYAGINGGFFILPGLDAGSPKFPQQPVSLNTASSFRWTGQLTAPVAGVYELTSTSTGTSRLFIDGKQVLTTVPVAKAGDVTTAAVSLTFAAGSTHDVRIEYINDAPRATDAGPQFKFGWRPPVGVIAPQATAAAALARSAKVAIVVVRDYAGEGEDKQTLRLPNGQAELIRQVAAANPRTIVVMTTGSPMQTSDWESGVPAVLQAWYGGQEQGNAVADILFGDINPSGKLPITSPVDDAKTPVNGPEQFPIDRLDSQFTEGIFVGYRGYEQFSIKPQYPFGHGLSYTTFDYSNLRIAPKSVTLTVRNSGRVAGSEVVQVYAGALPTPVQTAPKSLAGFARVPLQPGQSQDVTIALDPQSLSYWNVNTRAWVAPGGTVPIMVGSSSADIRLRGTVQQTASVPLPLASGAKLPQL